MLGASELLEALRAARTPAEARHALHELEDRLTPSELVALLPAFEDLSGLAAVARDLSTIVKELRNAPPQPYLRRDLAADVVLFHAAQPPRDSKSLIIALCGR